MADSDTLKLKVLIRPEQLKFCKEEGFSIGFARDIEDDGTEKRGNVVFAMIQAKDLDLNMSLEWQNKYETFETINNTEGREMVAWTRVRKVEEGQRVIFGPGKYGVDDMVWGVTRPGQPFTVTNEWNEWVCVGVKGYDASIRSYATFYVSWRVGLNQNKKLRPLKKFTVFWTQHLKLGTKFRTCDWPGFQFDFDSSNEVTLEFKGGKEYWRIID